MTTIRPIVLAAMLACGTSPAAAEDVVTVKAQPKPERICENITVLGSRLAVKRICATREEWAERKRQDRDMVDQAQRAPTCAAFENGRTVTTIC